MAIYNEKYECMEKAELESLQSERLVKQVNIMYKNVGLFRKRMDEKGLKPESIRGIEDISKLPFSYKRDLRDNYPFGLFAVPMKDIKRLHTSSGTTGKQIVAGYTENDLKMWAECMARQFSAIGASDKSIVQISYGYGLFTGGLGIHGGAEKIGAAIIPASSGNTKRQIQTMIDFGATILCCTPSYALYLGETIEETGVKNKLRLKAGIFGAEPWTEDMRKMLEYKLNIKAYDVYGLTEIMGPGVAYECECQSGMHISEDMFIAEIVDPDTGETLPNGTPGELVLTAVAKEAFPVIRYRTHDICSLNYEKCKCGRTFVRMNKPAGRSDDMLIIRGVNVFPSQIEEVLLNVSGDVTPNYRIIADRVNNTDTLEVQVEMSEKLFSDSIKPIEKSEAEIKERLRSVLGLSVKVTAVEPKTIQRSEGKAKRVIDNRRLV